VGFVYAGQVCRRKGSQFTHLIMDRITSLDLHRPMLIDEDDCDVALPSPIEDRYIQPQGFSRSHATSAPFTGSLAVIQISRSHRLLYQALKSSIISSQTLQSFDEMFREKGSLLPEAYRLNSSAALETTALPPVFTLLSAQFHLHRRNLTPVCRAPARAEAMSRCVSIAQDTAKYISRTLHTPTKPDSEKTWQVRATLMASNMVCLHLWRCMLVLCFRGDYDAAFMCLHLASAIGKTRRVNGECGRNIVFFLDRLLDRIRNGHGSPQQLEQDEEMLAYVSGDVQGNMEHSWVWAGTAMTSPTSSQRSPLNTSRSHGMDQPMRDALPLHAASGSPKQSEGVWDDWSRIEHMIQQLREENRPRTATYYPTAHNPVKRVQLAAETKLSPKPAPTPSPAPSSTSRISIANII
jgi:hypothetical protein